MLATVPRLMDADAKSALMAAPIAVVCGFPSPASISAANPCSRGFASGLSDKRHDRRGIRVCCSETARRLKRSSSTCRQEDTRLAGDSGVALGHRARGCFMICAEVGDVLRCPNRSLQ